MNSLELDHSAALGRFAGRWESPLSGNLSYQLIRPLTKTVPFPGNWVRAASRSNERFPAIAVYGDATPSSLFGFSHRAV